MSQELAQDEAEADAEDYEIGALERGHRRLATHDDEDGDGDEDHLVNGHGTKGQNGEENVVFAMGEDSDDEDGGGKGYKDDDGDAGEARKDKGD
jgi:hypothetical protein